MYLTYGCYLILFCYVLNESEATPEDTIENLLAGSYSSQKLTSQHHPDSAITINKRNVILSNFDDLEKDEDSQDGDSDLFNKRSFKYAGVGKRNFKYSGVGKRNFKYSGVGKRNFKYSGVGKRNFKYSGVGKRGDSNEEEELREYLDNLDEDKRSGYQYVGVGKRSDNEDDIDELDEDKRGSFRYSGVGKRDGFRYAGVGKRGTFKYSGVGKRDSFRYAGVGKRGGEGNFKYASFGKREDDDEVDDKSDALAVIDSIKRSGAFKYSGVGKRDGFKYAGVGKRSPSFMYAGVGKRDTYNNDINNNNENTHLIHKRDANDDLGIDKLAKRLGYAYMYPSVGKRDENEAPMQLVENMKRYQVRPRSSLFRNQPRRRGGSFRFQGIGKRDESDGLQELWKYSGIGKRSQGLSNLLEYLHKYQSAPNYYSGYTNSFRDYDME